MFELVFSVFLDLEHVVDRHVEVSSEPPVVRATSPRVKRHRGVESVVYNCSVTIQVLVEAQRRVLYLFNFVNLVGSPSVLSEFLLAPYLRPLLLLKLVLVAQLRVTPTCSAIAELMGTLHVLNRFTADSDTGFALDFDRVLFLVISSWTALFYRLIQIITISVLRIHPPNALVHAEPSVLSLNLLHAAQRVLRTRVASSCALRAWDEILPPS